MIEIKNAAGTVLRTILADDLRAANLPGADLHRANLPGADLNSAYLHKANLYGANLRSANLYGADISGADLRSADLYGANLRGANLKGTILRGTVGVICLGHDPRGFRFIGVQHDDGWRVHAGCRWFTIPEALTHWRNNPDALARVAILHAHGATHN